MDIEHASPATALRAQATMQFLLRLRERGIAHTGVLRALEQIPREEFVPHRHTDLAWRDMALPIACGQTMPEPYLVARMVEALGVQPGHRVLEIGTGNGYSAAILSRLAGEVVTVERFRTLASAAAIRFTALGLDNVRVMFADGLALHEDLGLFDRILVQGAVVSLPETLLARLATGGVAVYGEQTQDPGRASIVRLSHGADGLLRERLSSGRLQALIGGVSGA
jgi:protein-L-isoaspartate(D-aspartate) O-methyltransferase